MGRPFCFHGSSNINVLPTLIMHTYIYIYLHKCNEVWKIFIIQRTFVHQVLHKNYSTTQGRLFHAEHL